jgi:hypothetical protein
MMNQLKYYGFDFENSYTSDDQLDANAKASAEKTEKN